MKKASALLLLLAASAFTQAQTAPSSRPAITGIAYVRVYTTSPAASADFYGRQLGYDHTTSNGITRYAVSDSQWFEVAPLPSPAPRSATQSRLAIVAFTTRDAAGLERYLQAHNVTIDQPLAHGQFGVHDPEGNHIVFVQQRAASTKAISPRAASHRIIHSGFMVRDSAKEDTFYREILGFHPYWHGGMHEGDLDWSSLQVPDGTDWIEYMLWRRPDISARELGVLNHFSLGTTHMADVVQVLARNKCEGPNCAKTQMGKDGKVQLNVFDPDLTRIEYMEFQPSGEICCSPFTGTQPSETEDR